MKVRRLPLLIITGLLVLGFLGVDATLWALTRIKPIQITLNSTAIPADFDEMTIVYFSDTHWMNLGDAYAQRVITGIMSHDPDVIVFGGDLVTEAYYTTLTAETRQRLIDHLKLLDAPLGQFALLSETDLNHRLELESMWMAAGFEVLNDQRLDIYAYGDDFIRFIGIDEDTPTSLADTSVYTLGFTHDPRWITDWAGKLDVLVAGKTHGGQIVLPIIGSLVTSNKPLLKGQTVIDDTTLIVSSGVGVDGLKARLFADPDYVVITLKP
jgi:predicted MPP superfamily phosphohydrolase